MLSRRIVVFLILAASLIGALVSGRELFYNLLFLWATIVGVAAVWTWLGLRGIRIARHTRALRAQVGRPLEERLAVRNLSRLPKLWLEVRDRSNLPGHMAGMVVVSLGPGHERAWVVRSLCHQRGRFQLGPMSIASGDPFGLFQITRQIPQTTQVIVYPATFDLRDFSLPVGMLSGGDALRRRTPYVTANAAGVRDYAPGDSLNRIHWPSTARRDRLIVKEFELDPMADVWLFVDGDDAVQASQPTPPPEPPTERDLWMAWKQTVSLPPSTEEYAVSLAATLAQYFIRRDRAVGLLAYGATRECIQPDRGERQLTKLLETLAVFHTQGRLRFHEALTVEAERLPRGVTLILVTSSWDMRWVVAAQSFKRRGLRVVAVVLDPSTFGGPQSNANLAAALWVVGGVPTYRVKNGDDIAAALAQGAWTGTGNHRPD
jgi:uncharacterized protein (DUF58 family)